MSFLSENKRSHYCGTLRADHHNETVVLMGWVDTRRDHGGLVFVDLRDREGMVQVVLDPNNEACQVAKDFRNEYVVAIRGNVRKRPEGMANTKIPTGEIEVEATSCEILSAAETPPFQVSDKNVSEMLRLKHRYLDLRTQRLQSHLILRHKTTQIVRRFLSEENFLEIETPILYKSTPEGARDYLVPSRVSPGNFFALPQSPQTLKQLLMIGGMDRYFQIARCFRDEDLRADRQPEFSQIDIEMSFVETEDVISINERLVKSVWKEVKGVDLGEIPRISFQEAMERYGSDKPDVRFGLELKDLKDVVEGCEFKVFNDAISRGGTVRGFAVPGGGSFSRAKLDKLTAQAKKAGAKGLVWIKSAEGKLATPIAKFFSEDQLQKMFETCGGKEGDLAMIVADDFEVACSALSSLRLTMGQELDLIDTSKDHFLWVVDFPLLEYSPDDKRWVARHHPFTAPKDEHLAILEQGDESRFHEVQAKAYDLVCNGHELAGGSVRIHRTDIQATMFKALGLTPEETQLKFGFFLEALKYGTPPHGGIAWGVDRLLMILCGTDAIREVIAFPKTTKAMDLMAEAPSEVSRDQLIELGIRLAPSVEKAGQEKE